MATISIPAKPPESTHVRLHVRWSALVGAIAMAAMVAIAAAIVIVCAQRASVLVPPSMRAGMPGWLGGPLHDLVPSLSRSYTSNEATFSLLAVAMFGLWLVVLATVRSLAMRLAIAGVVALHLVLLLAPPMPLTDVFNYINYARMGAVHHLNPYVHAPASGFEYAHDPAGIFSNWHHLKSPYGQLFTLATYPLAFVSVPVAFWLFKIAVVSASLGSVALAAWCADRLGRSAVLAIVVVGLNPVAMIWGIGAQHNDSFMVLLILGAITLWLSSHDGWAAALLVGACALKISALPLLPLFLLGCADRRGALKGAATATAAAVIVSVVAFGPHLPDFSTQMKMVSTLSFPNQLGYAIGIGGQTAGLRSVMSGLFVLVLLFACWRVWRCGTSWLTAAGWVIVASLVTTGWLLPWYIAWLAPFAVLAPARSLLAALIALSTFLLAASLPSLSVELRWLGYHPGGTDVAQANLRYLFHYLR